MISGQLSNKVSDYEKKLARMVDQMAEQIVAGARMRVIRDLKIPKNNSPLADSLRVEKDPMGGVQVVTDKPYARFVEFGTRFQPARPFLTPAVEEVKVTFLGIVENLQ